jgi:hypothetical protein
VIDSIEFDSTTGDISECLRRGNAVIHDKWFAIGQVRFDANTLVVATPLSETKVTPIDVELVVTGVRNFEVADTEKIENYDVNRVVFDNKKRTLVLYGNIPVRLTLALNQAWTPQLRTSAGK